MKPASLSGHIAQLYRRIKRNPLHADQIVETFFRSRKYLGAKDRQFIAERIYFLLRNYRLLQFLLEYHQPSIDLSLNDVIHLTPKFKVSGEEFLMAVFSIILYDRDLPEWLIHFCTQHLPVSEDEITTALQPITQNDYIHRLLEHYAPLQRLSWQYSIAPWILQTWQHHGYSFQTMETLANALLSPAPVCLRVNTLKISRDQLQDKLYQQQWEFLPTSFSPVGLQTSNRYQILTHPLYQSGYFEIQDEGSQLISFALAPQPHWTILDACAGAGGKSLHLATLQKDRGNIVAADVEHRRLKALRKRALRADLRSITTLPLSNTAAFDHRLPYQLQSFADRFDAVLIDAPCSATGRARRSPATKWYTRQSTVQKLSLQQLQILKTYAQCVAPGGILLYATCSLLPEENEVVVRKFLENHPEFEPDPLLPAFETFGIRLPFLQPSDWFYTLLPSITGTDGFFVARMRRRIR